MTIKLVIFDLDGTLVNSRETHYIALNRALSGIDPQYHITLDEHLSTYDGLPTTKKLELLTQKKGLSPHLYNDIWVAKQKYTAELVAQYQRDERICSILKALKDQGYLIYIASNCTWKNLLLIALHKGFLDFVDWVISNEDVDNPKPSPEIYFKCMIRANVIPQETLILEDSPIGKKSALYSGAHLLSVTCPEDLQLSKVTNFIEKMTEQSLSEIKCQFKCNVVIPMAGMGSRFTKAGYSFPKPLIDVKGKTMVQIVVDNLGLDLQSVRFIFIVQTEHYQKYDLKSLLEKIAPGCVIVQTDTVTEGAACTVLLGEQYIDNADPLVIANSDQFVEWDANSFYYQAQNVDCAIACFHSSHPKWSYAKLGSEGFVTEVAEKQVISNHATVGIYWYRKGQDFVTSAKTMIAQNLRVNNEFYVCPVFNELIKQGKKIRIFNIEKMWGLGTPEDLEYFLTNYKGKV